MKPAALFEYYRNQDVAPTFADFRDEASFGAYAAARADLMTNRLSLPLPFFRGREILEYGPDTGENAVVFARWGAHMTLVEPAVAAHSRIRAYFERFAPGSDALRQLTTADVLTHDCAKSFDMIVAEGFIYTIVPDTAWLRAFAQRLVPGGLALVSYYERSAALFELLLRVPFAARRRRDGLDRLDAGTALYRPKWDRIPHTRAFESWVMDVLDNPFVRLPYFLDASRLVRDAAVQGFAVHSSWPNYRDGLDNRWAKRPERAGERLERTCAFIDRSILTYMLGTKAFLIDRSDVAEVRRLVDHALVAVDALIDADDAARSRELAQTLRALALRARQAPTLVDEGSAFASGIALLDAWADVIDDIARGALDVAATRLRSDPVLLDGWGTPNHLAVFRADPGGA